jgi:hypothetical protein
VGLIASARRERRAPPLFLAHRAAPSGPPNEKFDRGGGAKAARPINKDLARKWLQRAESLAKLPKQQRGGWHSYRRKWATERKRLPLADVAQAGGWKSKETC